VTNLSPRLLAQHGGLHGLLRLDVAEPAQEETSLNQRQMPPGPGRSIAGARPGRHCGQNIPMNLHEGPCSPFSRKKREPSRCHCFTVAATCFCWTMS
jgi:hypothetical protein